jgi:hypothetical protein
MSFLDLVNPAARVALSGRRWRGAGALRLAPVRLRATRGEVTASVALGAGGVRRLCKNCGYPVDKRRSRGITIAELWTEKNLERDSWKGLARLSVHAVESHSPPEQQATSGATPRVSAKPGDRVSRTGC